MLQCIILGRQATWELKEKQVLLLLGCLLASAFIHGFERVILGLQVFGKYHFLASTDNIGHSGLEFFYRIQPWFLSLLWTGRLPKLP